MRFLTSLIVLAAGVTLALPLRAQVIANPDSGTADAGTASKAILNVATNDTVNGAPATLGASGNATVAKVGTWPSGVLLQSSGAITTTTTTAVNVYSVSYMLCDLLSPPDCSTATDTVTVAAPSIVPTADSGTADAGIASKPIGNVAVNDTIGGQQATLGAGGNATVSQSTTSPWPSGISLTPATGAVSTTIAVAANTYSLVYNLCDHNSPAVCVAQTDTVTVINSKIVPGPDSGTAVAGVVTKAIANIASNDTVNGAPATVGPGGNATVQQSITAPWPSGITLTPSTGAVKTTAAQLPGTYQLAYTLCDLNGPPAGCNTNGMATVTISTAIVAAPIAGSAVVGTSGTPIGDVGIPDIVNNAPVTFGTSGNATVTQGDGWPGGLVLDPATGAINSDPTVPVGTYTLPFMLCDKNSPPDCANGTATVAITNPFREVQASATPMGDIEFDWGRDGVTCATCNFGDGNNRANWTDRLGNIWIAHLDPVSGKFPTPGVNDELADTTAYFWNTWGNGPEWAFSTQNGQVVSQLVYSRWQPGQPAQPQPKAGYSGAAYTTQTAFNSGGSANWTPKFLPGAIVGGSMNSNLPEASQCNSDTVALSIYKNFGSPLHLYTEPVTSVAGTAPALLTYPAGVVSNGIGERFVPCTHQLLYQASAPIGQTGNTAQQVFWYDMDTGATEQLTTDPVNKYGGFMFQAPDFGDNYVFLTLSDHQTLEVFQETGTNADGSPIFQLVNTIFSPDPNETYMNSPEPFINCTPVCTTYAFVTLANTNTQNGVSAPNGLAVVALSPKTPLFNILVSAADPATRQRLDPEYFITPNGPYIYYNRIVPLQAGVSKYDNQGEWFLDMQLGAPTGACVGSSAEGGLLPGC